MFKKALSIFLIFTLVFLFASCGADKDPSESNNSNVFNPDAPTITQAADDADETAGNGKYAKVTVPEATPCLKPLGFWKKTAFARRTTLSMR